MCLGLTEHPKGSQRSSLSLSERLMIMGADTANLIEELAPLLGVNVEDVWSVFLEPEES
jgi:hypothetical protein